MPTTSTPKTILITGATQGIGRAAARVLARDGHTVLVGARDETRGKTVVEPLVADGYRAELLPLDVTDQASVDAAARQVADRHGQLDVLINNAGISRDRGRSPSQLPVEDLREIFETNVFGVVAVTNAMLPALRKAERAHIGNVGSGLGTFAVMDADERPDYLPLILGYNSSKAALNMITVIYARSLRDEGIRVNVLSPGYVATGLNNFAGTSTEEEGGARIAQQAILPADGPTGVFFNENGGVYPW